MSAAALLTSVLEEAENIVTNTRTATPRMKDLYEEMKGYNDDTEYQAALTQIFPVVEELNAFNAKWEALKPENFNTPEAYQRAKDEEWKLIKEKLEGFISAWKK